MLGTLLAIYAPAIQELELDPALAKEDHTMLVFGVAVFGTVALMLVFGRRRRRKS